MLALEASPIFYNNLQYLAQTFDILIMSFPHYQHISVVLFSCSHSTESQWCYLVLPSPVVQQGFFHFFPEHQYFYEKYEKKLENY